MTIEPNDTIFEAISSGLSSAQPGTFIFESEIGDNPEVAPENDVDLFEFQLDAGETAIIDIDADEFGSDLDPVLRIFDSFGNEVALSDDSPAPDEPFTVKQRG